MTIFYMTLEKVTSDFDLRHYTAKLSHFFDLKDITKTIGNSLSWFSIWIRPLQDVDVLDVLVAVLLFVEVVPGHPALQSPDPDKCLCALFLSFQRL